MPVFAVPAERGDIGFYLTGPGTVKLKALFQNCRYQLFPNQFVNARPLVEVMHDMIVVPAASIRRGLRGTFVYIVKGDRMVGVRPVTVDILGRRMTAAVLLVKALGGGRSTSALPPGEDLGKR